MKKILLSAFACHPTRGSEYSNGWNWAKGLADQGYDVHCYTRDIGKQAIEDISLPVNLNFYFLRLPFGLEKLYGSSTAGMYAYYLLWQWMAFVKGKHLHKKISFDVVHHVSWGSVQMGSFLYKLNVPFIFGPAGGGQKAPVAFKEYFQAFWNQEKKRERITRLMLKYNPACSSMIRKAYSVLVSNPDTLAMVKNIGSTSVSFALDAALPEDFSPAYNYNRNDTSKLKLLWVGRFLPRKGILLLLDTMKELRNRPEITLTVVGDGEMRDAFLQKVNDLDLSSTVNWVGQVDYGKVKEYYSSHDVFFFTSLRDSCPAQLMEAMAFGLPIVTLNLHGQAIIVDDSTGIRCSIDSPQKSITELRDAILHLYDNPEIVRQLSLNAYRRSLENRWQKKINHITQVYYP